MAEERAQTLRRLADAGQVVADPSQDIRGRTVLDRLGAEIGKVDDLLVEAGAGKVQLLQVRHGGFLGIGTTAFFVPVEAITRITEDIVQIDPTREKVEQAPHYDPDLADQEDHYNDVYGYYGYTPFSAAGYIYPLWPSRH